jgi:hypothetical protein
VAKGSHATFDGYPRTCSNCGQPVRITGTEPLQFQWTPAHGRRSWHIRCLDRTPTLVHNPGRERDKEATVTETPVPTEPQPEPQPDDDDE